ncbi:MAG: formate dehydrogenase accessory sulfurtransferase FdhD, partial [Gammaproteobacteria bacterium]
MPKPVISNAAIAAAAPAQVRDETGAAQTMQIAGEYPLSIYIDRRELVTLMTLGQMPEALAIGWLRNQRLANSIDDIEEVSVDWQVNAAAIVMRQNAERRELPQQRTVTSGCGQGSVFGDFLAGMDDIKLRRSAPLRAAALF